jgi:serpin B
MSTECSQCKRPLQLGVDVYVTNNDGLSLCIACIISGTYKDTIKGVFKLIDANPVPRFYPSIPIVAYPIVAPTPVAPKPITYPTGIPMKPVVSTGAYNGPIPPKIRPIVIFGGIKSPIPPTKGIQLKINTPVGIQPFKGGTLTRKRETLSPSDVLDYTGYIGKLMSSFPLTKGNNVAISPLSLGIVLSMLGDICVKTKSAFQQIHMLLIPYDESITFSNFGNKLMQEANINSSVLTVSQALAIIPTGTRKFGVDDSAEKLITDIYDGKIFTDASVTSINAWAVSNTQGKIKQILPPNYKPSGDGSLILLNGLFFKAEWEDKFKSQHTTNVPFYSIAGGKDVGTCDMMFQNNRYKYIEGPSTDDYSSWQIVLLPYANCRAAAVIILHNGKKMTLNETLISYMSSWHEFWDTLNGTDTSKVNLGLPKFTFESVGTDLSPTLKSAGCDAMFLDGTGVAEETLIPKVPAKVDVVLQSVFINVNEEGTTAAAVTAVVMMMQSAMPVPEVTHDMKCDHPFIFNIVNIDTGVIYFTAIVNNPST